MSQKSPSVSLEDAVHRNSGEYLSDCGQSFIGSPVRMELFSPLLRFFSTNKQFA